MSNNRISAAIAAAVLFSGSPAFAIDALEPVVITASRIEQPLSAVIGSVTVITREQIQQRQAQSLQDLLRGETGIDITNQGGPGKLSSIFLRGANSSQSLILVDGVRLGSATAGITAIEFIPVDQIERIEIVRGPRSSLYGSDAMGGVIQIFTREHDGVSASVAAGTYDTQSYAAGFGMQGDTLRFSVNGSYLQSAGFDSCVGSYSHGCFTVEPDRDGYRNSSASAQLGYAFGERADLELRTLYAQGLTEYDGGFQNQTRFRNSAPNLRLRLNASPALSLTLTGGVTQDKSEGYQDNVYSSRFNTEKQNAGLQMDWRLGKQRFSAGMDYLNDVVDSDTAFTHTERDNTGIFAQWLGSLSQHELSASVRRDNNQQFGTHDTGNLGWKWFVSDRTLALNAGWGQAFHAPSFNDLYYPYGYGNPELKPERSQSYELGASGTLNALNWSLQLYSTQVKDLIAYNTAFLPDNISEARLQGAELTLNGKWDKLSAGLNYTIQNPRSREPGVNHDHLLARRARNSGRLDLGYTLRAMQLATHINAAGSRYDNLANTLRMPGYVTVDLSADLALNKAFAVQMKLGNLFDTDYETVRYYRQAGRSINVTLRYQTR